MDLNLHIQRGILLADRRSLNPLPDLKITQKNGFPVDLYLLADGPDISTPVTVIPLPSPYTVIVLSARPNDDLDEATLLFFLDNLTVTGSGQTLHYTGTLNSATAATAALFAAGTPLQARKTYGALLDIDLLVTADPNDGRQTVLQQRDFTLCRAIWQGSEGIDPDSDPQYPLPSAIFNTSDLATAALTIGQATVDFNITAAGLSAPAATLLSLGVKKPNASADNIGIVSVLAVNATTLRAYLTAAPSETGYTATLLFKP